MAGLHAAPLLALMLLGAEPSPAPVTAAGFADAVLKPHRGRTVVVNFWSTFCQPCLHEIPVLQKLDAKLWRDDVDLVFVATDPVDLSRRVSQTFALKAPGTSTYIFADDSKAFFAAVAKLADAPWQGEVPYTLIVGPDGVVRQVLRGEQTAAAFATAVAAVH